MAYAESSLLTLPDEIRNGMIAMGIIGLFSTISTLSLIVFITYRMVFWRNYYHQPIHTNQVFMLIYNLLLADLQQALSFLFSWHWIAQDQLVGPTPACFAQGWLIQIGDVSSGMFVLAIGVHTFVTIVWRKQLKHGQFIVALCCVWSFCLLLTALAPILHTTDVFIPSGAWCWINSEYEHDRLVLHYLWIFIAQLGSLIMYMYIFFFLRVRLRTLPPTVPQKRSQSTTEGTMQSIHDDNVLNQRRTQSRTVVSTSQRHDAFGSSRERLVKTARYMVVYPFAYVALSLPLAAGRVAAMTGKEAPKVYFCVAGALMATCGLADTLLYLSTRRAIIKAELGRKRRPEWSGRNTESHGMSKLESRCDDDLENQIFPDTPKPGSILVSTSIVVRDDKIKGPEVTVEERTDSMNSLVDKAVVEPKERW